LPAPHCELEPHSAWQVALMQRNAVPQSESNVHCATAGFEGVTQKPLVQLSPTPQVELVRHAAWHEPLRQDRPDPHCASFWHSTSPESPHVLVPFV
jgi:hypothetical protein